ncbi:sce7726 family protein [Bifidobacterium xylocopae]|uniref:sce7726 family protein n=1 Tax=Bifidobacterium xylocopae TaxID=2493119 RepID=UPI0038B340D3
MINRCKSNNGPDVLKLDEFALCSEVRADITVINGHMTGYELKSASDNLKRLPKQVSFYSKVLDYCNLVVAENHFDRALQLLPSSWGIYIAKGTKKGSLHIRRYRTARIDRSMFDARLAVELLWRDEALDILTQYGYDRGVRSLTRPFIWDRMVERFTPSQIRQLVRHQLKSRQHWRVVSPHMPDDESCSTSATDCLNR